MNGRRGVGVGISGTFGGSVGLYDVGGTATAVGAGAVYCGLADTPTSDAGSRAPAGMGMEAPAFELELDPGLTVGAAANALVLDMAAGANDG